MIALQRACMYDGAAATLGWAETQAAACMQVLCVLTSPPHARRKGKVNRDIKLANVGWRVVAVGVGVASTQAHQSQKGGAVPAAVSDALQVSLSSEAV